LAEKYREENLQYVWLQEKEAIRGLLVDVQKKLASFYDLESALGIGSTSVVLGLKVIGLEHVRRTLKMARPKKEREGVIVAAFEQEIEVLQSVSHENIIKVHYRGEAAFEDAASPFFVVDYVEKPEHLDKWFFEKCHDLETLTEILWQISSALNYLHKEQIVHCDVKPANIFIGNNNHPLLADLGYSKYVLPSNDKLTSIIFTQEYAHPELIKAARESGSVTDPAANIAKIPRSKISPLFDLYAFGKTIWKLFAGKPLSSFIGNEKNEFGKRQEYISRYLKIIAGRLLDGMNTPEEIPGFTEGILKQVKYLSMSETQEDFEKLSGRFLIEHKIPELDPYLRSTTQLPITGRVPFTEKVLRLANHPYYCRLDKITQLGLLALIYPAATHSRYEHCLGTFANACSYIRALFYDPINPLFRSLMTEDDIKAALLAALLHDVGQYPLAHDLEDIDPDLFSHKEFTLKFLEEGSFAGMDSLKDIIQRYWSINTRKVLEVIEPKLYGNNFKAEILHAIIDGPIDADKLDYLRRDSGHLGIPYGLGIDVDRLLKCLTIIYNYDKNEQVYHLGVGISDKGRTSAEAVAFARYAMFASAYWHHTSRAIKAMLGWAVREFLPRKWRKTDKAYKAFKQELWEFTLGRQISVFAEGTSATIGHIHESDARMLLWLRSRNKKSAAMLELLLNRSLYKRIFTLGIQGNRPLFTKLSALLTDWDKFEEKRKEIEKWLLERIGKDLNPQAIEPLPLIIFDLPRKRPADDLLFVVEEGAERAERLQTSVVWNEVHDKFYEAVSRFRIFAHPDAEHVIKRNVSREQIVGQLTTLL
jgi:HD superfamily phosphohydrolase